MTIAYCVNIWNHYQGAFCRAMAAIPGIDFKMVLFSSLEAGNYDGSKSKGGARQPWIVPPPDESWIVLPPRRREDLAHGIWNEILERADVAVVGYCMGMSREALQARERAGKPTFFMGERLYKSPIGWKDFLNPHKLKGWWSHRRLLSGKHTYYLEISHDGHRDLQFLHVCRGRIFCWSYFPAVSESLPPKSKGEKLRLGWCGRLIDWKHVEYIVKAIGLLSPDDRNKCEVTLVGEGPCKVGLIELSKSLGLENVITFETYKPVEENMAFMRSLDVYLFPSDRGEGWGVALMEAMDKGCVPIGNCEAGATLDLIEDGVNGFVFEDGDVARMAEKISWLIHHREACSLMGRRAWETMQKWSPSVAADMLLRIVKSVKNGKVSYSELPAKGLGSLKG